MIALIIIGAFVVVVLVLWTVIAIFGQKFDRDWEKMSPEERFKLQNEARKRQITG